MQSKIIYCVVVQERRTTILKKYAYGAHLVMIKSTGLLTMLCWIDYDGYGIFVK